MARPTNMLSDLKSKVEGNSLTFQDVWPVPRQSTASKIQNL